ncbi:MAG: septum formation initiator family protein [Candidatus Pacebacteria bacterium]|nr:septum formation initiator family protein [Candidatus Paceibacterota bacterium]
MRSFQDKKKWRKVMESKPVLGFLSIVILVFSWSVVGLIGKMQETSKNKQAVQARMLELTKNKEKLTADISKLQTDEGMEESIREKFGWVKEGEGVIVVVDDKSAQEPQKEEDSGGIFSFFKNLFK